MPETGTLDTTPYPQLLLTMAKGNRSGVLELQRNQLQKTIVFDEGSPVECRSNIATEMLGRFLVSAGKVSESDVHAAFAVAATRGVPIGEILTERKLLTPTELYRALQQNLGRKLLEPFSWKSGTWSISDQVPPLGSVLRVKVPQLIVTGIVKVETQEAADEAMIVVSGKYLAIDNDSPFDIEEIRLTKDQQKVVEAARKAMSFDEVRKTSGIDPDDLNRIVYALLLIGVVKVTDKPERAMPKWDAPKPVAAAAAPAAAPFIPENPFAVVTPSKPRGTEAASAEEVMSAYLSYRRKDAFDLLGATETDGLAPITQVYLRIAEKFLPSNFDEFATDGLREKAKELFLAAARAYAELADPERRDALIKKREKLREHARAAAQTPQSAMIDPEALCQSGRTLAAAGKLREALSNFEMAAECDAQNGAYAAEAAWCRFQLKSTPPQNALKLLKNALRIDPNCGVAYLYAGQVMAALGSRLEAEAYLGRAASLLPNDPRPAAAQKALR
jgi:hypothetical protein